MNNNKDDDPKHYFRLMKELTLLGFFTSEPGATQALRYVESPGNMKVAFHIKKAIRPWALINNTFPHNKNKFMNYNRRLFLRNSRINCIGYCVSRN